VVSRSGWLSDRSACYLASGRPVVAQDTGLADRLPTGSGLHAFTTQDEFADAAARLRFDYGRHARAARAIAEEFLDARQILRYLLRSVGGTTGFTVRRLHAARDEELVEALAAPVVGRRPSPYRSTAPLLEVDIETDAGVRGLVVKDVSPRDRRAAARRAKPA